MGEAVNRPESQVPASSFLIPSMRIELIIDRGPLKGTAARIKVGHYLVGRHSECQIRPDDSTVSARHCLLWNDGAKVGVSDLHSTLGTFVNEEKLEPHVWKVLKDGDLLRVGELMMRVAIEAAEDERHRSAGVPWGRTPASRSSAVVDGNSDLRTVPTASLPETTTEADVEQDPATTATQVSAAGNTVVVQKPDSPVLAKTKQRTARSSTAKPTPAKKRSPRARSFDFSFDAANWKLIGLLVLVVAILGVLSFQTYRMINGPAQEVRTGLD